MLERIAVWLARPDVSAHDPSAIAALREGLAGGDLAVAGRHGGVVCYASGSNRRRLLELDRRGLVVAALSWDGADRLRWARCRLPDHRWIGVEPRGGSHLAWGASDRVWSVGDEPGWTPREPVTIFQAVDWARPDFIPPLAEPARLPGGAGTAILNLLAALMEDQGVARVRYRGPYPTEGLFTALLESFRYDTAVESPLETFLTGRPLDWMPAPHERHHVAASVCVQLRHEVEKVVLDGAAFYRTDWQGVRRREPRVVRFVGERAICSLWALERPVEDRLVLDRTGEVLESPAPRADPRPEVGLSPVWQAALAEVIGRESPPILGEPIGRALRGARLEWGSVPGDLLRVEGDRISLSRQLRDVGLEWVCERPGIDERGNRAARFVLEIARLLAPEIRLRAQRILEALPEDEQQRRWVATQEIPAPPPAFTESVGRLVALVARGHA
jgi:hypothetical protein